MTLYLATGNMHKKQELAEILRGHRLLLPADAGIRDFEPEETGSSFAENALIKARALYTALQTSPAYRGEPVIADDSGLCVDLLGGRPGIFSARYGAQDGKKLPDHERNLLLLDEIAQKWREGASRRAFFACAMVLMRSPQRYSVVQETLEGEIVKDAGEMRGGNGFGYDPLLFLPQKGCTVAELSESDKNALSHRGRAARLIARLLDA
jgi:XTP/dITP diphosphohydrolase